MGEVVSIEQQAEGLPNKKHLSELMTKYGRLKADMDEVRGEIGALVKDAEETRNIHRGAFKLCAKLKNMDDTKRSEFLMHFDHYREKMLSETLDMFGVQEGLSQSTATVDDDDSDLMDGLEDPEEDNVPDEAA